MDGHFKPAKSELRQPLVKAAFLPGPEGAARKIQA
jgi:hypothetical protein